MSTEVLERMQSVFNDVFLDEVTINPTLSANDVDEWDSLTHVSLVVSLEKEFSIRFATGEVETTKNVGELCDLISRHIENK